MRPWTSSIARYCPIDRISRYFETIDMDLQRAKQKAFLTYAFGGPANYSGQELRQAHANMHLNEADFDAVMGHLGDTLAELGVPGAAHR